MARISENDAEHYQSGTDWFTLKNDHDIATIQFMYDDSVDEVDVFVCHTVKVGDKDRYVDCLRTYDQPVELCPLCAAGLKASPVRMIVMFQHDDQKIKIWERGKTFMTTLQGLFNRYRPLSEYVFEIERFGKAGDTNTKYQVYPMDRAEPYDLSQVEYPELLGSLILTKTAEEMEHYLDTGRFPSDEPEQRRTPQINRRTPANNTAAQAPAGSRRAAPQQSQNPSPRRRPEVF